MLQEIMEAALSLGKEINNLDSLVSQLDNAGEKENCSALAHHEHRHTGCMFPSCPRASELDSGSVGAALSSLAQCPSMRSREKRRITGGHVRDLTYDKLGLTFSCRRGPPIAAGGRSTGRKRQRYGQGSDDRTRRWRGTGRCGERQCPAGGMCGLRIRKRRSAYSLTDHRSLLADRSGRRPRLPSPTTSAKTASPRISTSQRQPEMDPDLARLCDGRSDQRRRQRTRMPSVPFHSRAMERQDSRGRVRSRPSRIAVQDGVERYVNRVKCPFATDNGSRIYRDRDAVRRCHQIVRHRFRCRSDLGRRQAVQ